MRILIVSDTHKSHVNLEKVLKQTEHIDTLIHLGDVEGREKDIEALVDCPVHMVRGNNDFFSELPREEGVFYRRASCIHYARAWLLREYGRRTPEAGSPRAGSRYCDVRPHACACAYG